jgi:hypothetical protein
MSGNQSSVGDQAISQDLEFTIYNPEATRAKKLKGPVACAECEATKPPKGCEFHLT